MKKILLVGAALLVAHAAFPQGQVNFNNRANASGTPNEAPGVVVAPFYNLDPACNTCQKQGNTTSGRPAGSVVYNGPLLMSTPNQTYTATLWALKSTTVSGSDAENNLVLVGTTTMRTSTSGSLAGTVENSAANPVVTDVVPGSTDRATFQVRVWCNTPGVTTWADVLARPSVPRGYSTLFTVPYALTTTPNTPPNLEGLTSFQLFIVPEPSVIALGVLGAGCLFLLRRRK
jgi:hypothetical protein